MMLKLIISDHFQIGGHLSHVFLAMSTLTILWGWKASNLLSFTVHWLPAKYCGPTFLSLLFTNIAVKLLLRLEKYPHRMNFTKGILESRKVHYKHLRSLLVQMKISSYCILLRTAKKALPLNTPTSLELSPNYFIRVTLFDVGDHT